MTDYREILRLRSLGINHSQIALSMGISRQTVVTVLQRAGVLHVDWQTAEGISDQELARRLFPPNEGKIEYKMPDYAYIHREMAKPGMTQQLLWFEYYDQCRNSGELPYQLTQFKTHYRAYLTKTKATMHINRKPGETMEVDWAGQTAELCDDETGEILSVYVFVSVLPYSGYAYAEAFLNQKQEAWTTAHVHAYNYFGGVARMLVPDNLKTGVLKHTRSEVVLNKSYQELAEHYGTAILPARVRSPKDKASVEGAVSHVSSFILAALRNQRFFSLREMNAEIRSACTPITALPEERWKPGYLNGWERASCRPCPKSMNCRSGRWQRLRSTITSAWQNSTTLCPFRTSAQGGCAPDQQRGGGVPRRSRICSHVRLLTGRPIQHSETHMPPNHQQYIQWNGSASEVGSQVGKRVL